ncbi:MAG: ABC transporter ATP-binding protein [Thermoanaerobaculaceae bacterium]|nr:ABC transporter ATP-binding protein [Thermoanaerobaculaceae bacterium]
MQAFLSVDDLAIAFPRPDGERETVVDGVSFSVSEGEAVGVVGESGSGKTLSALAAIGLLPVSGRVVGGRIRLAGQDVLAASEETMCSLRGRAVGYLSQETGGALNPVRTVGFQVGEAARLHLGLTRRAAQERVVALLSEVGLEEPLRVARSYPHQLSGGQRQRALLAAALAADPQLLIADEPTSALDTITQARLLGLLAELRARRKLGLLLISHDLGLVARMVERVVVLHAGETVEEAPVAALLAKPAHPFTRQLLTAAHTGEESGGTRGWGGEGRRGGALEWGACRFAPRCPEAMAVCWRARPALEAVGAQHAVRCFLHHSAEEPHA